MRMLLSCLLLLAASTQAQVQAQKAVAPVSGQAPIIADTEIRDMSAVVVTGVQPGPGMWKVSKGNHVMWVLGTTTPLPKGMQWLSRDVEAVIAQAQEVID